ncbi:hypothetical protein [Streptomyces peucetius]|uniref:WD40 repeat domain-containing protein n=1 Tax=Streptomyces peucetius TaxID=1950 RepID=A0ABY6IH43_STRPE|nr:hypothetical protein [Streptomyces peucetius]UYQ65242.1 hypothetical protein OGH68_29775 [Streptomyces peucetius]
MANQLGVVAGTPAGLLAALLSGAPRTVRLAPAGQDPAEIAELASLLRGFGHLRVVVEPPADEPEHGQPPDLADPDAVCAADPLLVTAAYEASPDAHGGLRAAWLRAGQSLIRDQGPARRALVLMASLPPDAEPRVRGALARLSGRTPWALEWSRPCQVAALTVAAGALVVADPAGGVRTLDEEVPRTSTPFRTRAVAALDEETWLLLDERGRLHRHGGTETPLTKAVAATLESHPGTALAAAADTVLVGDRMGSVHAFGLDGLHQAALHSGRVTALSAVADGACLTVHSGGGDGAVHIWSPGAGGHRPPVTERPYPVVALHAGRTPAGPALAVAWADGLVRLHLPGVRRALPFRPGPAVRAVAVTPDGTLCVGTEDTLVGLRPRQGGGH